VGLLRGGNLDEGGRERGRGGGRKERKRTYLGRRGVRLEQNLLDVPVDFLHDLLGAQLGNIRVLGATNVGEKHVVVLGSAAGEEG